MIMSDKVKRKSCVSVIILIIFIQCALKPCNAWAKEAENVLSDNYSLLENGIEYSDENYVRYEAVRRLCPATACRNTRDNSIKKSSVLGLVSIRCVCLVSRAQNESGKFFHANVLECEVIPMEINSGESVTSFPVSVSFGIRTGSSTDVFTSPDILQFDRTMYSGGNIYRDNVEISTGTQFDNGKYAVRLNMEYQVGALFGIRSNYLALMLPTIEYSYIHYNESDADEWAKGRTYLYGMMGSFEKNGDLRNQTKEIYVDYQFGAERSDGTTSIGLESKDRYRGITLNFAPQDMFKVYY